MALVRYDPDPFAGIRDRAALVGTLGYAGWNAQNMMGLDNVAVEDDYGLMDTIGDKWRGIVKRVYRWGFGDIESNPDEEAANILTEMQNEPIVTTSSSGGGGFSGSNPRYFKYNRWRRTNNWRRRGKVRYERLLRYNKRPRKKVIKKKSQRLQYYRRRYYNYWWRDRSKYSGRKYRSKYSTKRSYRRSYRKNKFF